MDLKVGDSIPGINSIVGTYLWSNFLFNYKLTTVRLRICISQRHHKHLMYFSSSTES
jgi:hypothetical protein